MKADIQKLQANLIEFGLNPADWVLETQSMMGSLVQMTVQSKEDQDVVLQGWAEQAAWLVLSYQG